MPPTHPPSLLTLTAATFRDEALVPRGGRVLAAVSGGPDSMALLHVLGKLRNKLGFELHAHGIDHGLRPEAARELDLAEALARSLDVPFERTRVAITPGGNLQARARAARYQALYNAARHVGATRIATGHHADDRAETVLLRLLRGAGPAGLGVLPAIAPFPISLAPEDESDGDSEVRLIRPLIRARRATIEAHLARHGISYAEDPSNANPRYLRTRVRQELLPVLTALDPRIVEHLCALADDLVGLQEQQPTSTIPLRRATRLALEKLVREPRPNAQVLLPGGLVAAYDRAQGSLQVTSAPSRGERSSEHPVSASSNVPRSSEPAEGSGRARARSGPPIGEPIEEPIEEIEAERLAPMAASPMAAPTTAAATMGGRSFGVRTRENSPRNNARTAKDGAKGSRKATGKRGGNVGGQAGNNVRWFS